MEQPERPQGRTEAPAQHPQAEPGRAVAVAQATLQALAGQAVTVGSELVAVEVVVASLVVSVVEVVEVKLL